MGMLGREKAVSTEDASKRNRKATLQLRAEQLGFTVFMFLFLLTLTDLSRKTEPQTLTPMPLFLISQLKRED